MKVVINLAHNSTSFNICAGLDVGDVGAWHCSSQGESDTRGHTSPPADSAVQPRQAIWCSVHLAMNSGKKVRTRSEVRLRGCEESIGESSEAYDAENTKIGNLKF